MQSGVDRQKMVAQGKAAPKLRWAVEPTTVEQ